MLRRAHCVSRSMTWLRLLLATMIVVSTTARVRAQAPINPEAYRNRVCTLFGGPDRERVQGVSVLANGDVLVAGETKSNFSAIAQFGSPLATPYDSSLNTSIGHSDACLAVMDSNMTTIKYWTYLGGDGNDRAYFAMEDNTSAHNIWVSGFTGSYSGTADPFPVSVGQSYKNGGCTTSNCEADCYDVYVAKFDATLHSLLAASVIAGSGNENPRGTLTLDSAGNVYISGGTTSPDFFTTSGMPGPKAGTGTCASICGGAPSVGDAFVAKLK